MRKACFKLDNLLQENPIAYYWNGFLAADGCFRRNSGLKVALATKDCEHLDKLKSFIDYRGNGYKTATYEEFSISDVAIVPQLMKKFNFQHRKTYNPCSIEFIEDNNLLLSFIIGFIDGDGSIKKQTKRKDAKISIKCHSSWLHVLQYISDRIAEMLHLTANIARINNSGYAIVNFTNSKILQYLKRKALELQLPVMVRKWSEIDMTYVSGRIVAEQRKSKLKEMLQHNFNKSEVAKALGVCKSAVSLMLSRDVDFFSGLDYKGKRISNSPDI